jgi:hypothetical protein
MWLLGRLGPDHKTIADFRKDNGPAIRKVCAQFVALCRELGLLTTSSVAIDGSKFKAVNNRDKNFTRAKMARRLAQIEESVARYLSQLDTADRQEPSEALATKTAHLKEKPPSQRHDVTRPVYLRLRFSEALRQRLEHAAEKNRWTMTAVIIERLEKSFEKQGDQERTDEAASAARRGEGLTVDKKCRPS